ncbi:MobA-like NTP transferase domain-containing protein [Butyrivibrio hungatei DSM 14810]|uniref:MobA-like NTP transferase domain-containing protein n=1 Tax=Butyrivibrio hungatei DSM 14810 TaxID=1121132 RepID=A0A1M7RYE8_9FIRM|nr:glycosyltransferase family 2 protein [Butyrivibrio hungatei]SHN51164.1 MobA-like NTP transferase domain-containing protein [Butyrivibrio hungatei DSM 14810]
MLNIVVPMAGRGSRFADAGYVNPKPLIDVNGRAMIELVADNIRPKDDFRFIFICQREHMERFPLEDMLGKAAPGCEIIPIDYVTEGAACTVLLAEKFIDNDDALMIANSDQYVDIDINDYLAKIKGYDGLIMTMPANHPKWSYIRYTDEGLVTEVREKEVISDQATVGIYNYSHGKDFVKYAHQMIDKNIRVNNEFYVAPVYNEMIADGGRITYFDIGEKMHGLGTPEDLNLFLEKKII